MMSRTRVCAPNRHPGRRCPRRSKRGDVEPQLKEDHQDRDPVTTRWCVADDAAEGLGALGALDRIQPRSRGDVMLETPDQQPAGADATDRQGPRSAARGAELNAPR